MCKNLERKYCVIVIGGRLAQNQKIVHIFLFYENFQSCDHHQVRKPQLKMIISFCIAAKVDYYTFYSEMFCLRYTVICVPFTV